MKKSTLFITLALGIFLMACNQESSNSGNSTAISESDPITVSEIDQVPSDIVEFPPSPGDALANASARTSNKKIFPPGKTY